MGSQFVGTGQSGRTRAPAASVTVPPATRSAQVVSVCPACGAEGDHSRGQRPVAPLRVCTTCAQAYLICPHCGGVEKGRNHACPALGGKLLE